MNMNNTNNNYVSISSYEPHNSDTDSTIPILETSSLRLGEVTRDPEWYFAIDLLLKREKKQKSQELRVPGKYQV